MGDIRAIGAFLIMAAAAVLSYFAWALSTEKTVYGNLGRPPLPVLLYVAVNAVVAIIGVVIIFKM